MSMRARPRPGAVSGLLACLVVCLVTEPGCGGTMNTGTAAKPVNDKPAADGSCPSGQTLCGTGVFAICVDLQNDPGHCGTCDHACSSGIACQAGICQQAGCTSSAIAYSSQTPGAAAGTTTVSTLPYLPIGQSPILADVDGDGRLDRVQWFSVWGVCESCPTDLGEFQVSLGQADGSFAPPDSYHAADVITGIFVTDVNSDGLADLYVASWSYQNAVTNPVHLELWLGQRDGHLVRAGAPGVTAYSTGESVAAMSDLSGDGWPDLVMASSDTGLEPSVSVFLSDATGALHLSQTIPARIGRTVVADWNEDGSPDLMLVSDGMEILYNHGDGTFGLPVNCAMSMGVAFGANILAEDFDHDGRMDLAMALDIFNTDQVGVMLGLGGCGFTPVAEYTAPGSSVGVLQAADMNGDGVLDIVEVSAVRASDPNGLSNNITDNLLGVLIGNGDGTFHLQDGAISLGALNVTSMSIAEVSGDQRPDIVIATTDSLTTTPSTQTITTWENTCQ